jgi:hypothetical protein
MGFKTLSYGGNANSHYARKKKVIGGRKIVKNAPLIRSTKSQSEIPDGAVYLSAEEYDEFALCVLTRQEPTVSIKRGAELIKTMYKLDR